MVFLRNHEVRAGHGVKPGRGQGYGQESEWEVGGGGVVADDDDVETSREGTALT